MHWCSADRTVWFRSWPMDWRTSLGCRCGINTSRMTMGRGSGFAPIPRRLPRRHRWSCMPTTNAASRARPTRTGSRLSERLRKRYAAGRGVVVVSSKGEANRWLKHIAEDGLPEARPLNRMNIVGESGSGKTTLANRLGPLLDLPVFSVDELFWEDEETRKGGAKARDRHVDQILSGERWLADGVYWRPAVRFSTVADVTLHLDFPSGRAKRQREARGDSDRALREKMVVSTLLRAYPIVYERLLRRSLSEIAHLAPILEIRNDAELEAVAEGFRRGAEHSTARQSPEADAPVGSA